MTPPTRREYAARCRWPVSRTHQGLDAHEAVWRRAFELLVKQAEAGVVRCWDPDVAFAQAWKEAHGDE